MAGEHECNDHDLLIRANAQLESLTEQFKDFITTVKESNAIMRVEYTRNYDDLCGEIKELKKQHAEQIKSIQDLHKEEIGNVRTDLEVLKSQNWKAIGAVGAISLLCVIGTLYVTYISGKVV